MNTLDKKKWKCNTYYVPTCNALPFLKFVPRLVDITRFGGDDLRTRNAADLTRNADITRMMDITSMEDATRQVDITRMGGNGTIANMSQYVGKFQINIYKKK